MKMLAVILCLWSLSIVACNKKNDNTAAVPVAVAPLWTNCPSCVSNIGQGIPGLVGVQSASGSGNALFSFDVIVDQRVANLDWNNPKAILFYSGPVSLQGALRILSPNDFDVCNAPPGDYQIRPLTPSAIASGGTLAYGTFEALSGNGSRIVFRVGSSSIYNAADPNGVSRLSSTNRIQFNLILDSVNGIYCDPLATR